MNSADKIGTAIWANRNEVTADLVEAFIVRRCVIQFRGTEIGIQATMFSSGELTHIFPALLADMSIKLRGKIYERTVSDLREAQRVAREAAAAELLASMTKGEAA